MIQGGVVMDRSISGMGGVVENVAKPAFVRVKLGNSGIDTDKRCLVLCHPRAEGRKTILVAAAP